MNGSAGAGPSMTGDGECTGKGFPSGTVEAGCPVGIFRSEGKTDLMTGLVKRPTRPSCTAWAAVAGR